MVENDEFGAFARRILAAHGRRVATGDIEGLRDLDALGRAWDQAMHAAIAGAARRGLLVGRDRRPARHHPPGHPTALGLPRRTPPI